MRCPAGDRDDFRALRPDARSAQATVYRHVALLVKGGLLEVEEEQQVRGAVGGVTGYCGTGRRSGGNRGRDVLEEHRLGFTAAMAA
jgi:hypothetical protein